MSDLRGIKWACSHLNYKRQTVTLADDFERSFLVDVCHDCGATKRADQGWDEVDPARPDGKGEP